VAARLGEMLYWVATLVVILILGAIACAAFSGMAEFSQLHGSRS